ALLAKVLAVDKPVLVDADGLNLIAEQGSSPGTTAPRVLTPHPGEAARLLACTTAELQADRFTSAQDIARRFRATVVLKGAGSIIADDEQMFVNVGGNPGMA